MNHLENARFLTDLLDQRFSFFGLKFGLDPILGLIPGGGDLISFVLSLYLIWIAYQMSIPQKEINKMFVNVFLDLVVGSIPLVGDAADFFFKANVRNLHILKNQVDFKKLNP